MIVLISAKQGGGKSALKTALMDHYKNSGTFSFADCPYACHDAVKKVLGDYGIDTKDKEKEMVRELAEWARARFGRDVWVKTSFAKIMAMKSIGINMIINDDLRFKHEFEGMTPEKTSDVVVTIRLECAEEIRKERAGENWREDTNHISEVDLDDWTGKFDIIIHTDTNTKQQTFELAKGMIEWIKEHSNTTKL